MTTVTVVVGGYRPVLESFTAIIRRANPVNVLRFRTPARLYVYDTLLERLAQGFEDMAAEFGPCIQEAHAVVRERHLARPRHVAPADQPRVRKGVGGAERPGHDQRRPVAREASDAMETRGLKGLSQSHGR
jgi:hypothetical protein